MKGSLLLIFLLACFNCLAQTGVDPDLQSAVAAGNQAWIDGMRSGDGNLVAGAYATDAVNCTADGQCVSGAYAIASQLRSRFASFGRAQTANVTTSSLVRDRDLAYEWGYAEAMFGGGRNIRGRYLTVWQRQPGGGWKILRNLSLPGDWDRRPGRDMDPPQRREQSLALRCESDDMGRHSCTAPYQVSRAEVLRQISGSQCLQGTTFGWTGNSIWVDRGCRAEFTVYGFVGDAAIEQPATEYNDRAVTQTLRCESNDEGYKFCAADGSVRRARMVRQVSGSPCTETKTWGWKSDGVWVDKGCRAEFEVVMR
jgi:ketosteroid isomerase-like protein